MKGLSLHKIIGYVEKHMPDFHRKRLQSLAKLKLSHIVNRKNPYLFKAKNILTAQDFVKALLDAHLSSQEETIFGEFLEGLAIFICGGVCNGRKSSAKGIDLEFHKEGVQYIVAIKSGPHWGNSSQIAKMRKDFVKAKRILSSNRSKVNIVAVNGCCYGRDSQIDKGDYLKLCGQRFWEFISGNKNLYLQIIEPLGYTAKQRNEEFLIAYSKIINKFTIEFSQDFCTRDGMIDWKKLVKRNSAA